MLKIATGHERPGDYTRQLDMNTGVATTTYTVGGKVAGSVSRWCVR